MSCYVIVIPRIIFPGFSVGANLKRRFDNLNSNVRAHHVTPCINSNCCYSKYNNYKMKPELKKMRKKRKHEDDDSEFDPAPRHLQISHMQKQEKRLIVILENAALESVKVGNNFELMNCDDHTGMMKKYNRDPTSCRPDILHQCLLMLLDSPLNRAGLLQVYIHTDKHVLVEVNPQTRIPRTFKRFAGLMVQLLHKFSVRASEKPMKLLKVIENPVTQYLPVGCKKILMSYSAKSVKNARELVPPEEPIAIVIGAMAHGQVTIDYAEEIVSISNYPLSGALTCSKVCSAVEESWGVL